MPEKPNPPRRMDIKKAAGKCPDAFSSGSSQFLRHSFIPHLAIKLPDNMRHFSTLRKMEMIDLLPTRRFHGIILFFR
jgi:hypothetical protein